MEWDEPGARRGHLFGVRVRVGDEHLQSGEGAQQVDDAAPDAENPTMPTVRSRLPMRPVTRGPMRRSRCASSPRSGRRARLPESRIIASVYSATGAALASAADVSRMSRSQKASDTTPRTLPAAWNTARSRGSRSSMAASRRGRPSPSPAPRSLTRGRPRPPRRARACAAGRRGPRASADGRAERRRTRGPTPPWRGRRWWTVGGPWVSAGLGYALAEACRSSEDCAFEPRQRDRTGTTQIEHTRTRKAAGC